MKYFQITVYLEQVTETTDHTGTHKLKKYSENYLVKTDREGEVTEIVLENFKSSDVWATKQLTTDLKSDSQINNFYKKEITQIKELPISGDIIV